MEKKLPNVFLKRNKLVKKTVGERIVNTITFILFTLYAAAFLYLIFYLAFCSLFLDDYFYDVMINNSYGETVKFSFSIENYIKALSISASDTKGNNIFLLLFYAY